MKLRWKEVYVPLFYGDVTEATVTTLDRKLQYFVPSKPHGNIQNGTWHDVETVPSDTPDEE